MKLLEERIRKEGRVLPGDILKIDSFLNHQIDIVLMDQLADEFFARFSDVRVDKVLTLEASGIASAALTALKFKVPMVFAKKSKTSNIDADVYSAQAYSYTHSCINMVIVSKAFLQKGEHVLIVDDFLANGQASLALADLIEQAGAEVAGIGILVEKAHQAGRGLLEARGYRIEALARIASMDPVKGVVFAEE